MAEGLSIALAVRPTLPLASLIERLRNVVAGEWFVPRGLKAFCGREVRFAGFGLETEFRGERLLRPKRTLMPFTNRPERERAYWSNLIARSTSRHAKLGLSDDEQVSERCGFSALLSPRLDVVDLLTGIRTDGFTIIGTIALFVSDCPAELAAAAFRTAGNTYFLSISSSVDASNQESLVLLSSGASIWLPTADALNGHISADDADANVRALNAFVSQLLGQTAEHLRAAVIYLRGSRFHAQRDRFRTMIAFAGVDPACVEYAVS